MLEPAIMLKRLLFTIIIIYHCHYHHIITVNKKKLHLKNSDDATKFYTDKVEFINKNVETLRQTIVTKQSNLKCKKIIYHDLLYK